MPSNNPRATKPVFDRPFHIMLVNLPIVFFVATLVCDSVFWCTGLAGWAEGAQWMLAIGLVMAALAAFASLRYMLVDRRILEDRSIREIDNVWLYASGNATVVVLEFYNFYFRCSDGVEAVVPTGLLISLVVVGILLSIGWEGWSMIYRYGADDHHGGEPT